MAVKLSWKKALVHYLYGTIRSFVESFIANFGIAINADLAVAALAYFLVSKWDAEVAEAMFYGAIQSIGMTGGLSLAGLFRPAMTSTSTTTVRTSGRRVKTLLV